ncbi:MAG: dipeptide/oligopeptide/nickel ABC transporter permease/ATP-binding protein [Acetobacteraceae bacterium]|nr:dipeptide/oligopeptide/nickel ABC transporter permease/ATP-binding protein [Acetobacteraceae bacterium]
MSFTLRRLLPSGSLLGVIILLCVAAPVLPLHDPIRMNVAGRLALPSAAYWLGQDEFGRDVFARLLWGGRVSLAVSFVSTSIACIAGVFLGLVGGYFRGLSELVTVRLVDVVLCFPPLLLALLVVTLLGPGSETLVLVLSILFIPGFARVTFGEVLTARTLDYVEASRALGASASRILLRTILPNVAGPILVQFSLTLAAALLLESGLSFLGLGVVPPAPSWGLMIRGARAAMEHNKLLLLVPCAALVLLILAINLFCDGLRDVFDPRGAALSRGAARRAADLLLPGLLGRGEPPPVPPDTLLSVQDLTVRIATPRGAITAVDGVGFDLAPGETLAVVGESGSGKSMTGLALLGLLPRPAARITAGQVWLQGRDGGREDLAALDADALRAMRGRELAMIFQEPMTALNPVYRIGTQISEALEAHGIARGRAARSRGIDLLRHVGVADPERRIDAFPHELSGGMRQRAMIALALACNPRVLIADEPTTALDVTVQAQVLDLLAALQDEHRLGLIFITHNLAVVAEIADRVLVMYAGQVVEEAPAAKLFARPLHPYTRALLESIPRAGQAPAPIPGMVPNPHDLPRGCRFAPRCAFAITACTEAPPPFARPAPDHASRCIRHAELPA